VPTRLYKNCLFLQFCKYCKMSFDRKCYQM
jgi:hypothetical protein